MTARPYTAEMLAERWECSAETVRQLVRSGRLQGFRVGRMIRIPAHAVEEYECQGSASDDCAAASVSTGPTRPVLESVISLRHAPERKRNLKVATDS